MYYCVLLLLLLLWFAFCLCTNVTIFAHFKWKQNHFFVFWILMHTISLKYTIHGNNPLNIFLILNDFVVHIFLFFSPILFNCVWDWSKMVCMNVIGCMKIRHLFKYLFGNIIRLSWLHAYLDWWFFMKFSEYFRNIYFHTFSLLLFSRKFYGFFMHHKYYKLFSIGNVICMVTVFHIWILGMLE